MATDLTKEAQEGRSVVAGAAKANPYLFSSPCWMAWEAGYELRGMSDIISVHSSRGYSVRVATREGGAFRIRFEGKKLHPHIDRT